MTALRSGRALFKANASRVWRGAGVVAALVVAIDINLLVARSYSRWDWTSHGDFTLTPATQSIVGELRDRVELVVFLSQGDGLLADVRQLLQTYQALSNKLEVRFVDPDRQPAQFLALQQRFKITAGRTENGRLLTDTAIVASQANRHWYITADDLVALDEHGQVEPRLEQSLTEGIAQVTQGKAESVCFSKGHHELSIADGGPQGLSELVARLEKSNLNVEEIDLATPKLNDNDLAQCRALTVAGPSRPLSQGAAATLQRYLASGGNLALLLDPIIDEAGRVGQSGLESLLRARGLSLGNDYVIERDPALRLPDGIGETFLGTPQTHAITRGLALSPQDIRDRPTLSGAQSLSRNEGSTAEPLLTTSPLAVSIANLELLMQRRPGDAARTGQHQGPLVLGYASSAPGEQGKGSRLVVLGSSNLAHAQSFREPTLSANQALIESALSWLVARPTLVSVPQRRSRPAGLALTEQSLSEVFRYVVILMPATAAFLGMLVLLRRRREQQSHPDKPRQLNHEDESDVATS